MKPVRDIKSFVLEDLHKVMQDIINDAAQLEKSFSNRETDPNCYDRDENISLVKLYDKIFTSAEFLHEFLNNLDSHLHTLKASHQHDSNMLNSLKIQLNRYRSILDNLQKEKNKFFTDMESLKRIYSVSNNVSIYEICQEHYKKMTESDIPSSVKSIYYRLYKQFKDKIHPDFGKQYIDALEEIERDNQIFFGILSDTLYPGAYSIDSQTYLNMNNIDQEDVVLPWIKIDDTQNSNNIYQNNFNEIYIEENQFFDYYDLTGSDQINFVPAGEVSTPINRSVYSDLNDNITEQYWKAILEVKQSVLDNNQNHLTRIKLLEEYMDDLRKVLVKAMDTYDKPNEVHTLITNIDTIRYNLRRLVNDSKKFLEKTKDIGKPFKLEDTYLRELEEFPDDDNDLPPMDDVENNIHRYIPASPEVDEDIIDHSVIIHENPLTKPYTLPNTNPIVIPEVSRDPDGNILEFNPSMFDFFEDTADYVEEIVSDNIGLTEVIAGGAGVAALYNKAAINQAANNFVKAMQNQSASLRQQNAPVKNMPKTKVSTTSQVSRSSSKPSRFGMNYNYRGFIMNGGGLGFGGGSAKNYSK